MTTNFKGNKRSNSEDSLSNAGEESNVRKRIRNDSSDSDFSSFKCNMDKKRKMCNDKCKRTKAFRFEKIQNTRKELNVPESVSYFDNIAEAIKNNEVDDEDSKKSLAINALEETIGKEVELSCYKNSSECLEVLLLNYCSDEVLLRFLNAFENNKEVLTNPKATHITELLIYLSLKKIQDASCVDSEEDNKQKYYIKWIKNCSNICLDNLDNCLNNSYSCHVLSTLIAALGGKSSENTSLSSKKSLKQKQDLKKQYSDLQNKAISMICLDEVPKGFCKLLKKLSLHIQSLENLEDYILEGSSAVVIESLMLALRNRLPKRCKAFIKAIADIVFREKSDYNIPAAFTDRTCSFVIQFMLEAADDELFIDLWTTHIASCVNKVISHPICKHAIQNLFEVVNSHEKFNVIYNSVEGLFRKILQYRDYGILTAMAKACSRFNVHQEEFLESMMKCLQCYDPEENQKLLVPLLFSFTNYKEYVSQKSIPRKISFSGSIFLQTILSFQAPIKVVTSMLNMNPAEIQNMACDRFGCYVLTKFFESTSVDAKSKDQFIQNMKPILPAICQDKEGNLTLSRIWTQLSVKQRAVIAKELVHYEDNLSAVRVSNQILKKFQIFHFKHNYKKWERIQKTTTRRK